LLQNSLGGNARTSMICCVSPVVYNETIQTLKVRSPRLVPFLGLRFG